MAHLSTLRIACDGANFDAPSTIPDGRKISFWRGCDLRLELALFQRGQLEDLDNLTTLAVEVHAMGPNDTPPDGSSAPFFYQELAAEELNGAMTLEEWQQGTGQQAVFLFSHEETGLPAGDAWMIIWAKTTDERIIPYAAGRILVRESSRGGTIFLPPDGSEGDNVPFLRKAANLADLADGVAARTNLGLGAAATRTVLNEENLTSDSQTALPTQHSVKVYADGVSSATFSAAKNYADGIGAEAQTYADGVSNAAQNYADGVGTAILSAAKSYTDDQLEEIGGGDATVFFRNLWPSNSLFNYSTYTRKPYFVSGAVVSAVDGWNIYENNPDATNLAYFFAVPAMTVNASCNDSCFDRSNGNVSPLDGSNFFRFNRPFTWKETAPLRGHTITLSFGLKFGADFPQNSEGHGLECFICGTTRTASQLSPNYAGQFPTSAVTIATLPPILSCTTDIFTRQTFTFDVPQNVTQICIHMRHCPLRSGDDVGNDYKFYLRLPTIRIGADGSEPELTSRVEDMLSNRFRFQRVLVTYSGSVTSGDVITQRIPFSIPLEDVGTITCLRGYDEIDPVGFPTAAPSQASSITPNDFVITRTANATGAVSFRTWYSFGILLWTFSDAIPNF